MMSGRRKMSSGSMKKIMALFVLLTAVAPAAHSAEYKKSYLDGLSAVDGEQWREVARLMILAINDKEEAGEKIRTSGMNFVTYLPHYYLGLALYRIERCQEAIHSWKVSVEQGAIQKAKTEYAVLMRGLEECGAKPPVPVAAPPAGRAAAAATKGIEKRAFEHRREERSYHLYVPPGLEGEVPVIVLLHGSGRDGRSLVEKWKKLAKKERFIVVGPDAQKSEVWSPRPDGGHFLRAVVAEVERAWPIDSRRIYLFGHSGGGSFAIQVGLQESEYFAAATLHAGLLYPQAAFLVEAAKRKIPMAMWVGDRDSYVPISAARRTRDTLVEGGFPAELVEMPGHNHWYYDLAPKINRQAWEFLRDKTLGE